MSVGQTNLKTEHIEAFRKIVGAQYVLVDEEALNKYGHYET